MKNLLAAVAIVLAVGPVHADGTSPGGGIDLLGEFAGQLQGDLASFAELTGQVMNLIEPGAIHHRARPSHHRRVRARGDTEPRP